MAVVVNSTGAAERKLGHRTVASLKSRRSLMSNLKESQSIINSANITFSVSLSACLLLSRTHDVNEHDSFSHFFYA
jgi:hypothetical protein